MYKIGSSLKEKDTIMRKYIAVDERLAIASWFLARGCDFHTIGHLFGVSKASVCLIVKEVCSALVQLLPQFTTIPTVAALTEVIKGFEQLGFPSCAGAIDGTHIPIVSPSECPADYYNRKGWHSVIMQGLVDHKGRFMDIYIGWPGRVHDARVFANSGLFTKGQNGTLFPDWKKALCGIDVPVVILGDPAYPLLTWLMKAYQDNGNLTPQQNTFNYRLSHARVEVEHAYGQLKGRWRCLLKRLDVDIANTITVIAACCVLHNICETHRDHFDDDWMVNADSARAKVATVNQLLLI